MSSILLTTVCVFACVIAILYKRAYLWRHKYDHLFQPHTSFVWGVCGVVGEHYRKGDGGRHVDYVFEDIWRDAGSPPVLMLDFRPISLPVLLIASHSISEQLTRKSERFPLSTPKAKTLEYFRLLIGERSLLTLEGESWIQHRKHYNSGFAPSHLITLLPVIVKQTERFVARLDEKVRSQEISHLATACGNLTIDIIGELVLDYDLKAQFSEDQQSCLVRSYRELLQTYLDDSGSAGIMPTMPWIRWKRHRLASTCDHEIGRIVRQRFVEVKSSKKEPYKNESVLARALRGVDELTGDVLKDITDDIKTFLLAGHDTTSSLLQWLFFELSRSPQVLAKLRAEIDSVIEVKASTHDVMHLLLDRSKDILSSLNYTSAVIKEALRLYPPAGAARWVDKGTNFMVDLPDGTSVNVDDVLLYNCHYLIQRDENVYGGAADDFIPERWISGEEAWRAVPPSAWRPFERGPRNCIGQGLALLEAKVALIVCARRYDFVKIGKGALAKDKHGQPVLNEKGQWNVESPMYNSRRVTTTPVDGMKMLVKLRKDIE